MSSSGFILYKSHCSCTNEAYVSIIVKPATCESKYHHHHHFHNKNNKEVDCSENECHECLQHEKSCGCNSPKSFLIKLKDKAVNNTVKLVSLTPTELIVACSDILEKYNPQSEEQKYNFNYSGPPPKITSSLDYLIHIQQLKIPSLS